MSLNESATPVRNMHSSYRIALALAVTAAVAAGLFTMLNIAALAGRVGAAPVMVTVFALGVALSGSVIATVAAVVSERFVDRP